MPFEITQVEVLNLPTPTPLALKTDLQDNNYRREK